LRGLKGFVQKVQWVQYVQKVGHSRLPMLVFSPTIKGGEDLLYRFKLKMLEQIALPYSLFLIPYLLLKFPSPTVETVGYGKCRNV